MSTSGFFAGNQCKNVMTCALSVLILNYNIGVTSYVLYMIDRQELVGHDELAIATLGLVLGLSFGQLLFGIFGDIMGRRKSFSLCSSLMIIGGFMSIFSGHFHIFHGKSCKLKEFAIFRTIIGVGAGGMYPLVASITRESSQEVHE